MDAPSGELRQRRSELGGQSAPRGDDRSSAEGEERFGARWNGLTNESLAAPPVRHHGPGVANAVRGCSQTPIASAGSPALLAEERASSGVRPNEPRSPRSARPLRRKALRSSGQRYRLATVAWVLHASRGNTFRFVVCSNSISERHGAAAAGEQSPVAAARRATFDRKIGELDGRWRSRARSGRCQPARRTTGRRSFLDVSNRAGGSIEVVW